MLPQSSMIRYIESPRHNPVEHLATVLKARLSPGQSETPFALLDSLYHQIFSAVDNITEVFNIFQTLLSGLGGSSSHQIEIMLGYSSGQAQLILCDMHSLLHLEHSEDGDRGFVHITLHHKSLEDFFSDPLRSRHLYIDPKKSDQISCIRFIDHFSGN